MHSVVGSVVSSWTKAEKNVVPRLAAETWVKGKEQGFQEGQKTLAVNQPGQRLPYSVASGPESSGARHLKHVLQGNDMEGNTSALQPQDRVESAVDKSYKKKGKQKKVADIQTDQITINNPTAPQPSKGKGPTTNTLTGSQSSSRLAAKSLPNRKKQAKQVDEPITNAQMSIKNKNTKKLKPKDQVPVLVKMEGATNQLPPAQIKVLSGVSKIPVKYRADPNQENDRKGPPDNGEGSSNKFSSPQHPRQVDNLTSEGKLSAAHNPVPKGSSWLTNDPGLPGFVESKVSISSGSPGPNNAKTASGMNRKNTDSKSPTPVKASVTTITYPRPLVPIKAPATSGSIPQKNIRQLPSPRVLSATPKNPDWAPITTDVNGNSSTSIVDPIKPSTFIRPDILLLSPPDYAKAASGPNGRNMDQKLHTAPTSPSKNSNPSVEPTKIITTPTNPTAPPPPPPPTLTKGSPPSATHLRSSKSWSSIVTGNAANPNAVSKSFPWNNITIEGFPELATPLTMLPRAPNGTWDEAETNQKPSLSAIAEPFEPVGPRHAVSADSYLKTNNSASPPVLHNYIPIHPVAPSVMQSPTPVRPVTPILLPQTQIEYMSFPFDYLLGNFYDTPEFTKYLNKSYNELLFKENYLRAQYQRISEIFVEEWDYISALQRKAIVAKALSNISERVDKVQFSDGIDVEKLLRGLGLTKYPPTTSLLHKPTNLNLRDSYLQGAPANKETNEGSSKSINKAYLKWRAEYCFDCDLDPLCTSPDWLYGIISRLLGMPNTLRHRFGPGEYDENCDSSVTSNHEDYSRLENPGLWCLDDCLDCEEAENAGWPTEFTFVRNYTKDSCHSSSKLRSTILERFPDEIEVQKRYLPKTAPFETSSSQTQNFPADRETPLLFSQLSILEKARLMSNRFTNPIFARSDGWKAANPGRAKFMELMNIDIALFYCELIQEILQIFGEVRRDRVWIALPTIGDYYEGLPKVPTQLTRGRPTTRFPGEGSSRVRTSIMLDSLDEKQRKKKRENVRTCVLEERKRVWEFVNEVQRTMDWKVAGLKLVDRDTDREVERAYDGGLWTIPVPPSEKEMLEREFAKLCVWNR